MTLAEAQTRTSKPLPTRLGHVHVCNGLDPKRDGGMVPSILGMTGALAEEVGRVTIVTPTPSRLDAISIPPGVDLIGPESDLESYARSADVLHLHGLWQAHTRRGARAARRYHVPYLITAHGMAEPWALRHKALKKKLYMTLVERRNLQHASCLHALSRPEIDHLRALAPDTPICLVPNGVDLNALRDLPAREELERTHPEIIGKFTLLFLGRLHVKKGLDFLAEAIADVAREHPQIHLLLAGADDGALVPFLKRRQELGISDRVTLLGHVAREAARRAWGAADAFVLPSRSEGFSMAVLEALACGLPTVITTACHFPELREAQAGIVNEPSIEGVTLGLRSLLKMNAQERLALGARGRSLVESRYTWTRQAQRLAEVYRWVRDGGPKPEAIVN
ncbi:MAG: glycosyltransferase [Isosphaeraceae bacterium]